MREGPRLRIRILISQGIKALEQWLRFTNYLRSFATVRCATILVSVSDLERQIRAELRR